MEVSGGTPFHHFDSALKGTRRPRHSVREREQTWTPRASKAHRGVMSKKFWLALLTVAMIVGPIWIVAQGPPTATYTNRTLNVAIPYEAPRAGTGQLIIDILNPEDA